MELVRPKDKNDTIVLTEGADPEYEPVPARGKTYAEWEGHCGAFGEELCALKFVCPDGAGRPCVHGDPLDGMGSWVPVSDGETNEWVSCSEAKEDKRLLCKTYSQTSSGYVKAPWGKKNNNPHGKNGLCCHEALKAGPVSHYRVNKTGRSWGDWQKHCARRSMRLCTLEEACPDGTNPLRGNFPEGSPKGWVAVGDSDNEWAVLDTNRHNENCKTYSQSNNSTADKPEWSKKPNAGGFGQGALCCAGTAPQASAGPYLPKSSEIRAKTPKKWECWGNCNSKAGWCSGCDSENGRWKGACCRVDKLGASFRQYFKGDPPECLLMPKSTFAETNYHICVAKKVEAHKGYTAKTKLGPAPNECWDPCNKKRGYCSACDSADGNWKGMCCKADTKNGLRSYAVTKHLPMGKGSMIHANSCMIHAGVRQKYCKFPQPRNPQNLLTKKIATDRQNYCNSLSE